MAFNENKNNPTTLWAVHQLCQIFKKIFWTTRSPCHLKIPIKPHDDVISVQHVPRLKDSLWFNIDQTFPHLNNHFHELILTLCCTLQNFIFNAKSFISYVTIFMINVVTRFWKLFGQSGSSCPCPIGCKNCGWYGNYLKRSRTHLIQQWKKTLMEDGLW